VRLPCLVGDWETEFYNIVPRLSSTAQPPPSSWLRSAPSLHLDQPYSSNLDFQILLPDKDRSAETWSFWFTQHHHLILASFELDVESVCPDPSFLIPQTHDPFSSFTLSSKSGFPDPSTGSRSLNRIWMLFVLYNTVTAFGFVFLRVIFWICVSRFPNPSTGSRSLSRIWTSYAYSELLLHLDPSLSLNCIFNL